MALFVVCLFAIRQLVASFSPGGTVTIPRMAHVGFVVDKHLDFDLSIIIPPKFYGHPQRLVQEFHQSLGMATVPRDSISLCSCKRKVRSTTIFSLGVLQ